MKRTRVLAGAAVILSVLALRYGGTALVVDRPIDHPDAIVSLASHEWERLPIAAGRGLHAPQARLILSLPQPVTKFNCHDCGARVQRLAELGIAATRVDIVPIRLRGTHGEAEAIARFAAQRGFRRVLIVTSPYHTRRALAVFRHAFAGMPVELGIIPAMDTSPARPSRWWAAAYDRAYVRYEWAAIVYYGLRYGVNPVG